MLGGARQRKPPVDLLSQDLKIPELPRPGHQYGKLSRVVFYATGTPFGGVNLCVTVDVNHLDKNSCDGSRVRGRGPDTCGCRREVAPWVSPTTSRKCVTNRPGLKSSHGLARLVVTRPCVDPPTPTPPKVDSPVTSGPSHQGTPRPTLTEHRGNGRRNSSGPWSR